MRKPHLRGRGPNYPILDEIIQKNMELVKELGENAITTLMGIAMKQVRGKASGQTVNVLLRKKIQEI